MKRPVTFHYGAPARGRGGYIETLLPDPAMRSWVLGWWAMAVLTGSAPPIINPSDNDGRFVRIVDSSGE